MSDVSLSLEFVLQLCGNKSMCWAAAGATLMLMWVSLWCCIDMEWGKWQTSNQMSFQLTRDGGWNTDEAFRENCSLSTLGIHSQMVSVCDATEYVFIFDCIYCSLQHCHRNMSHGPPVRYLISYIYHISRVFSVDLTGSLLNQLILSVYVYFSSGVYPLIQISTTIDPFCAWSLKLLATIT